VTCVTKFVIKNICADSEKCQAEKKNFQGERKKLLRARLGCKGAAKEWGAGNEVVLRFLCC
ncbi:MAG: hypothetical protein ACI4T7_07120, partial [Alloprevotella sp.]